MTHEQKPESAALPGLAYFSELITLKRGARSLRDVAPEIGISVATISRIESGKTPDLITFATLCRWLEMSPDVFLARYEPGKPPIKIEQKPESAEFRTREAHRQHIAQEWQAEGMSWSLADAWADQELSEAEARGAAEQRRKDAEGAEPVAWLIEDRCKGDPRRAHMPDRAVTDKAHADKAARFNFKVSALYTRPANVAALISEAVASERQRCIDVVRQHGISPFPIDDPHPTAEAINATLQNITAAICKGDQE